jgi:chromosomal replication initiator protein
MVQTLKHHAWATGNPPNESMVRGLSESHQRNDRKVIGVGDIVEAVGHLVGVSSAQMRDKSRSPKPSQARLLAMYFAKELTGATAKEVGAWFGRQHSTILSAHKKIASLEKNDLKVAVGINAWCIRELRQKVQSRLGCDLD